MHKKFYSIGILLLLILANLVSANSISLGSIYDKDSVTMRPGEQTAFRIYFFNMGNHPINVDVNAEYPSDLRVEIHPRVLNIDRDITNNPSPDGFWLILNDGRTFARTYPVDIYVKVPSKISTNLYRVKLTATATSASASPNGGITQNLAQVREIILNIYVSGTVNREGPNKDEGIEMEFPRILKGSNLTGDQPTADIGYSRHEGNKMPAEATSTIPPQGRSSRVEEGYKETRIPGVYEDSKGGVRINLPTGNVVIDKKQKETAVDLGLLTVIISLASLILRVLK